MLKISMAPQTNHQTLTLQALAGVWEQVVGLLTLNQLPELSQEVIRLLGAQNVHYGLTPQMQAFYPVTNPGQVCRITLPEKDARTILRLAGVDA